MYPLSFGQVQRLEFAGRQLAPDLAAVAGQHHLDPGRETQLDDPVDVGLRGAIGCDREDLEVMRSHESSRDPVDFSDEAHDEVVLR